MFESNKISIDILDDGEYLLKKMYIGHKRVIIYLLNHFLRYICVVIE